MARATRLAMALAVTLLAGGAGALDVDGTAATLSSLRESYARSPAGLPLRLEHSLTAWQTTPRALVLAGDRTPGEEDPYVLTHPIFRFVWADGGVLVVDAGLSPREAAGFGRTTRFLGADPIVCGRDAFAGVAPARVRGALFTHLHVDHWDGLRALCRDGAVIPVRVSPEQRASDERFERLGREGLDALARDGCVREEKWRVSDGTPAAPGIAGFRGIHRVAVPGHTPGSQILVGYLASPAGPVRGVVVAGDVVNHRAGLRHDRPKPWWYRRLLVREDDGLQAASRALLARLERDGFEVWVNHHVAVPTGVAQTPCR
jgi:glyoxylase-like metal-dependent hydrolase (beta-lactamase superfamily II)